MASFVENVNKLAKGLSGSLVDELSYIQTEISTLQNDKADKTYVDTQLSTKVDTNTLTTELVKKADLNIVATEISTLQNDKVDKAAGKQLSTEDYTTNEKTKLASLDIHPAKHPVDIIDGSGNPSKFVKTDSIGNTGFSNITWSDVQGKPTYFTPETHTHSNNDIANVDWSKINSKPSSYNPSAHSHTVSDITDIVSKADKTYVDTQLANKVNTSDVTVELAKKADLNIVATDAELASAVALLQPLTQKGQANGYVPLDASGKIPNSYLNSLSTIEVFTASSQANMLLLSNVSVGDQCIRTDLVSNQNWILLQTPATDINNWKQLSSSASVVSVNGQTGVVSVSKADVGLANVDNIADANKAVFSATKLATARTITLSSDVTGSASFDGTGNISITATVADNSHNHTLSNISDFPSTISATELGYLDTVTSNIQTQLNGKQATLVSGTNIKTINGNAITGSGDLTISGGDMLKTTYDTTANGIVDRAEKADKLTNAITINGTSFDGSANVNIEERLGTAIASAATTTIGTAGLGETIHITGTTAITSLGVSTTGARRTLIFDGALVLTYNATSLILPTSANITTAAGDTAEFVCENGASGYWRCIDYQRRTGYPLTLGNLSTTGSAATLTTARTINGVSFNGSANINIEDRIGTAIASAATITIGTAGLGDYIHITGTTTITSFGTAATAGIRRTLIFDGALTLTHNATSLICMGGSSFTTVAGTVIEVVAETTANWRVVSITHPNVSPTELGYLDGVTSNIQGQIDEKQKTLVSGTNVKTINGTSIVGSGNLVVAVGDMLKTTYDTNNNGIVDKTENLVGGNNTTLLGSIPYQSDTNITTLLAPNIKPIIKFLSMNGGLGIGGAPQWTYIIQNKVPIAIYRFEVDTTTIDIDIPSINNNNNNNEYNEIIIEVSWKSYQVGTQAFVYLNGLTTHADYITIGWSVGSATKNTYNVAPNISTQGDSFCKITIKKIGNFGWYIMTESYAQLELAAYGSSIVYNFGKYKKSYLTDISSITLAGISEGAFKAGTVVNVYKGF